MISPRGHMGLEALTSLDLWCQIKALEMLKKRTTDMTMTDKYNGGQIAIKCKGGFTASELN